ncbi:hypothetical protein [Methyloversatilis discipulorum]|uniref:hypothetical protein n=1 Tax=Methyloversatilis discipulorum TaxID=1119528 RepID=UPI001A38A1FC|nr:hypothetical protein [Methyloversatilis discipulorum]MBL8470065.1 hypothetical protein [Methyloversatilis discipulorum]
MIPVDAMASRVLTDGYSDDELLQLSRLRRRTEAGFAPWASWEVENSSFGKTLRDWASYPSWLPMCAVSDHGVHWGARCWPNEIESPYRLFLSWNAKKARLMAERHGKEALHIPHPWAAYRSARGIEPDVDRHGTVVFFSHSNDNTTPMFDSLDAYMQSLKDLPESFHPVVICLSFHDVLKGMHRTLRRYGLPIVTAGTTNAQCFVDRFYGIARRFRYACSPTIGSHSFYLVEAGVPFFLYGPAPTYVIKGSRSVRDGVQDLRDYGDEEDIERFMALRQLFSEPVDRVLPAQTDAVRTYLGLDSGAGAGHLRTALWRSLTTNLPRVGRLYGAKAGRLMRVGRPAARM